MGALGTVEPFEFFLRSYILYTLPEPNMLFEETIPKETSLLSHTEQLLLSLCLFGILYKLVVMLSGKSQVLFDMICRRWILFHFNSSPKKKKGTLQPNRHSMHSIISYVHVMWFYLLGSGTAFFSNQQDAASFQYSQMNHNRLTKPPLASTKILAFWGSWKSW